MFISLDLETTGFNPEEDYIIEFGAVKFDLNGEKERLDFLVKSEKPIPEIVSYITKIENKDLEGALPFEERKQEIIDFVGDLPIVGHNIEFDTNFLKAKGIPLTNLEYDTHTLAGMLLHNLPSYSLEVISQTLGLQHEDKHRALDDAIAAMELFIELAKRFQALPPELIKRIQALCQKSNWPMKELLLSLEHKAQEFPALIDPEKHEDRSSNAHEILAIEESSTFEDLPPYNQLAIDLAQQAPAHTYIAVPFTLFQKTEAQLPDNIAKIDSYKNYLSKSRLEKFLQKEHFEDLEISAATKYLTWLEQTKTGLLSEIRIFGNERETLAKVNVDESISNPEAEEFIKNALEKDQDNAAICTHHYLLDNPPAAHSKLIILDLDQFKRTLHRKLSIHLSEDYLCRPLDFIKEIYPENKSIESLKSKAGLLFGILESLFESFNDKNEYSPRCNINLNIRNSKNWQNCTEIVRGLFEISKELGEINNEETKAYLKQWKENLDSLHKIFLADRVKFNLMWIERHYKDQSIIIRKIPRSTDQEMQQILDQYQSYKIIDEDPNTEKLFPDLPHHKLFKKPENLCIKILTDQASDPELMEFFTQYSEKNPGNSALIFNSKKQLMDYTLGLHANGVKLISQLTSSTGKLKAQFREFHNEVLSLMVPGVWETLEFQKYVDTLFIHRIPFDPPSKPEIIAASEGAHNAFMEVQIPAALTSLKRIINRLDTEDASQEKTIVIFDARLTNRKYGEIFVKMLEEMGTVEKVSLNQL